MARNFHNRGDSNEIEKIQHSIELDENYKMHVLGWKVQRVGWVLMFLFLVSTVLGFFGTGFLSKRSLDAKTFKIEYDHYGRYEATMKMFVHFPVEKLITVSIPLKYLHQMKMEHIMPEPQERNVQDGNYILTFSEANKGELILHLMPETTGQVNTIIHINDQPFSISHYIYP